MPGERNLRPYQYDAIQTIQNKNAIVKMPTGSGKTFIGAELLRLSLSSQSINSFRKQRGVFLVPTLDLVEQQCTAIQDWCGSNMRINGHSGGKIPPNEFDVIVSTPQAFLTLLNSERSIFEWPQFKICIFDEVHHVLKDHPYRKIALHLNRWSKGNPTQRLQIVGLSASLTYAVQDKAVNSTLSRLCQELSTEIMYSPTDHQLKEGGYIPQQNLIQVIPMQNHIPKNVVPVSQRRPHLMHETFMKRIKKGSNTEFSTRVWRIIGLLEKEAIHYLPTFRSPLQTVQSKLVLWEEYAHKCATKESNSYFFLTLEVWYVALRLLVQSWEEEEMLAIKWLQMNDALQTNESMNATTKLEIQSFASSQIEKASCSHLDTLREQLSKLKIHYGDNFRAIVFVQQRITSYILAHFINNDHDLKWLGIEACYIASRGSRITPSIKVTPSMATKNVEQFRIGKKNVIVATSVLEEGFDVPSANVVISFDHMKDSVELCQRFGRARQNDSSAIVMKQRQDRPVAMLEKVKSRQDEIIKQFDPTKVQINHDANKRAQNDRERNAAKLLSKMDEIDKKPVAILNIYVSKTKALLTNNISKKQGLFHHGMVYESDLRQEIAMASGSSKKEAKKLCALRLLKNIKESNAYCI